MLQVLVSRQFARVVRQPLEGLCQEQDVHSAQGRRAGRGIQSAQPLVGDGVRVHGCSGKAVSGGWHAQ